MCQCLCEYLKVSDIGPSENKKHLLKLKGMVASPKTYLYSLL